MKSTAMIAHQFRLQKWAEQIKDCNNRPHGMTVEEWCAKNDVTKANYYYRLKRVRQVYLETIPEKEIPPTTIVPVSIADPSVAVSPTDVPAASSSCSLEITRKGFSLTVTSETSLELLGKVLKVMGDA